MSFVDDMNTVMDTLRDEALVSAYDIIKDADAKIAELQAEVEKSRSQPDRQCVLQELAKSQQRVREFEALVPSSTDPLETLRDAVEFCVWWCSVHKDFANLPGNKRVFSVASATKKEPPKHVCGLSGFNEFKGDTCPGCEYERNKKEPSNG